MELPKETLSELTRDFISYIHEQVSTLKHMLTSHDVQEDLQYQSLLLLHNLKGSSSSLGFHVLSNHCHELEDLVSSSSFNYPAVRFELLERLNRLPQIAVAESIEGEGDISASAKPKGPTLSTLLYVSRRIEDIAAEPEKILEASREKNKEKEITGALMFSGYFFIQILEGNRERINQLYQKICLDPRHQKVTLCHFADLSKRHFGEWSMGYLADSSENRSLLKDFTGEDEFQPYDYSANLLRLLMRKLSGQLT